MFFAKIPRHTSQNAITEGDLKCILTRNCEGTEQLHLYKERIFCANIPKCVSEYFRQRILSFYFLRREQAKIIPAGEYGDCPTDTITKKFETICKSPACMRI